MGSVCIGSSIAATTLRAGAALERNLLCRLRSPFPVICRRRRLHTTPFSKQLDDYTRQSFENFSKLPHVQWDCDSTITTMVSYFSMLHVPLGLGGLSFAMKLMNVEHLNSQSTALSLVLLQLLELGGTIWLIQSSLKRSPLEYFNFSVGDASGNRGWLITSLGGLAFILLMMGCTASMFGHPPVEVNGKVEALKALLSGDMITLLSTCTVCCILTPCLEEIVYRGYLLQSLSTRFGWQSAVLISSFIFAVAHLDISCTPTLFLVGCVFGAAYTWSGNLAASYVIHALYNGSVLLFAALS